MVYTDGAYEPELAGLKGSAGLVVVDNATNVRMVQAIGVSEELLNHWGRNGSKQLIAYLELWPVLVFLEQYSYFFRGRRTVFFIDNNAVRDALIKGSSPNVDMFCMLAIASLHMSCFMNMINFYLLKGQSEFLHVKQKQLPCFKVSVCFSAHSWSSDSAIQVTRIVR